MGNVKRRALGKGLGTLLPERPGQAEDQDGYLRIPVNEIVPNPAQPRTRFDEEELEQLADSIRGAGVLSPVLVRDTDHGYELIAGERRVRAARMAGLSHVPARVLAVGRGRSLELALVENIQREQLNPIEEAHAYSALMVEYGLTQEEVARQVGRQRSSVANSLRLLKLPDRVQDLLAEGRLTAGHARALLSLGSDEEILSMAEALVIGDITVRAAEHMTRKPDGNARKQPQRVDPNVAAAELRLQRALGTKVRIRRSSAGKGRIEIEFYSDDELQRLFEIVEGQKA